MRENPLISLIVPVFNTEAYFRNCIESMVNQTYNKIEIILIDDGSVDNSSKMCEEYALSDSRIICIHQKNNGVSNARNHGLDLAKGDYIHFPDSDDYYEIDTYMQLLEMLNAQDAEAICFDYYITYPDREIRKKATDGIYGKLCTKQAITELLFSNRSFLCTKLFPAYSVKKLRFMEDVHRDEDTIFCMLGIHNVKSMIFVDNPFLHYVQSESSATRGSFRVSQLSAIKAIPFLEKFIGENYPDILDRWRGTYLSLMILLYRDMYCDPKDYSKEQTTLFDDYKVLYKRTKLLETKERKEVIKFLLFRIAPRIYCYFQKRIHKL